MVKILVSFEKKNLYFFLFGIGVIILFGFVMAFNSEFTGSSGAPATFGHSADELMVKIPNSAGSQFTLQNAIDNNLLSPAGYWTENGNDIYNLNTRNVGIGTTTPGAKMEVNGTVKITGGSPGAGKVLISSDATGLASWQTPSGGGISQMGYEIVLGGSCPAGKKVIGGGCSGIPSPAYLQSSYPSSQTTWTCIWAAGGGSTYAICVNE